MKKTARIALWTTAALVVIAGIAAALWAYNFRHYTPAEVQADIQAAIAARNSPDRVHRFLELRYGSLTDARNRQKAFLDFFNPGHIQGLRLIVRHTPEDMKQANTLAMAKWVATYRQSMTTEEKQALGQYFASDAGKARLREATGHYLRQDAQYRASTAPVIRELMNTVAAVQNQ
jgi:hypothetical protein